MRFMAKLPPPPDTRFNRVRYGLLRHLPGRRGARYAEKYAHFMKNDAEADFARALTKLSGTTCIDLGANVGRHTTVLAAHCARVLAFEPDPWTAARLRENVAHLDNVEVIEAAAGVAEGTIPMYRAKAYEADPEKYSESTSAFAEKTNVDPGKRIDVRQVDFPAFLDALEGPIGVLKIDIEGAEVALLEALFDHPAFGKVAWVFCETHESRLPDLAARTESLRTRAKSVARPVVNLDWR